MNKVCNKCNIEKPLNLFYVRKDGRVNYICKKCHNLHVNEHYKKYKKGLKNKKNKVCNECNTEKPLSLFYARKDGRVNYICKDCHKIKASKYYDENKVRLSERPGNKERLSKNNKKNYYNCDKSIRKLKDATYYHSNKEEKSKKRREYQSSEIAKQKRRLYRSNKLKTDECYRIRHSLKNRIYFALKGVAKSKKTLELLGCSLPFFKEYLENLFTEKMNWSNYGMFGWHIDHKKPCALFDLTKEEDQIKCFHYTNMQPLWCTDNILKGAKFK